MREIHLLSPETIDKIAAGEVVERPSSVVKELVENAIDAGAGAVTVEIRDGGTSMIRITDNGEGIPADQIRTAFLRHATSKLLQLEDLEAIATLGFRGEALSSICAVSMTEMITKTAGSLTGVRYRIEGGVEKGFEEIGAPEGTTILVRNLFYNVPARKKFLKSAQTEAGYVSTLMERLSLSHPDISFKLISNGQTKLHTSGNHSLKDIIYSVYGREAAKNLLEVESDVEPVRIRGLIGKPVLSRGNRNFETTFVNGRYIRSSILSRAIEEGYGNHLMQHRYPFTVLFIDLPGDQVDINVHPAKMEVRFSDAPAVFDRVREAVARAFESKELIVEAVPAGAREERALAREDRHLQSAAMAKSPAPEPFEQLRKTLLANSDSPYQPRYPRREHVSSANAPALRAGAGRPWTGSEDNAGNAGSADKTMQLREEPVSYAAGAAPGAEHTGGGSRRNEQPGQSGLFQEENQPAHIEGSQQPEYSGKHPQAEYTEGMPQDADHAGTMPQPDRAEEMQQAISIEGTPKQMELSDVSDDRLLSRQNRKEHRIIGQIFDTYWIVQFRDQMYIIDQHAAHEKVNYERLKKRFEEHTFTAQQLSPPIICTLSLQEENLLATYRECFERIGFEIAHFGGHEYQISAAPDGLLGVEDRELFTQILDSLSDLTGSVSQELFNDRLATKACKMSVKGGDHLTAAEADALIGELLELENPYNCPHGRPTIISMSKYDLEKKFKRIV